MGTLQRIKGGKSNHVSYTSGIGHQGSSGGRNAARLRFTSGSFFLATEGD